MRSMCVWGGGGGITTKHDAILSTAVFVRICYVCVCVCVERTSTKKSLNDKM